MSKEYLEAFKIVYNNFDYLISDVCIENDDVNICLKTIKEQLPTIKQALLKAQKEHKSLDLLMQELDCKDFETLRKYARCGYDKLNKKYLKWEDLEFKIENQEMFVLLNGSYYLLEYYTRSEEEFVFIKSTGTTIFNLLGECSDDKQFFNDLHLERVEE